MVLMKKSFQKAVCKHFVCILKFKIRALMHRNIRNEVYKQIAKGIQYSFEKNKKKKITPSVL